MESVCRSQRRKKWRTPQLIIIMVIILIIFGAGKLPEIGAGVGKAIKNFRGATAEIENKIPEKMEVKETS